MPKRVRSAAGRIRRRLSRNEAMVRWLGLSRTSAAAQPEGLILAQIDGLSRAQFEKALKRGRMPFLRRLVRKRGFEIHSMYSGLPSSTPAVQGELFYGVRCAVPAFSYRDPATHEIMRMFDAAPAAEVERRLAAEGRGLLEGGSAYCNIYSGGAAEPHFCASTMGWSSVKRTINPLVLGGIIIWHFWSILRTAVLAVIELLLALFDFVRGQFQGRSLYRELQMVPLRVGVNIVMREMIAAGAAVDVTRGLPIVQLNLLGYDEQAHRRGPSSRFAHWSLKGIDDAIKRVYLAARRSEHRKYTLWVYSDHGQDRTIPYARKFGRTIHQAIADIFGDDVTQVPPNEFRAAAGVEYARAQWIGGRAGKKLAKRAASPAGKRSRPHKANNAQAPPAAVDGQATRVKPSVEVVSLGPVGHVYPSEQLEPGRAELLAYNMVHTAGVPLVLTATQPEKAQAWTTRGTFELPRQAAEVFGDDHPYLSEVAADLVCLCHHPYSGAFILCGWAVGAKSISFADENGSHAGAAPEETSAFVLAPAGTPLVAGEGSHLRPADLRAAALRVVSAGRVQSDELDRGQIGAPSAAPQHERPLPTART